MNCELAREAMVGDDPADRAEAERHALDCTACAGLIEADRELARRVARWKAASPAPPADLRRRIATAIAGAGRPSPWWTLASRPALWVAAAAAAVLLAVVTWLAPGFLPGGAARDIEAILEQAERTRLEYARAIAELEDRAEPLLARAGDPGLPARQAALLLSYRDRLAHLDGVIVEVRSFLEQHPGHGGGNTVLLAAYTEKQEVLRQLLRLRPGERS